MVGGIATSTRTLDRPAPAAGTTRQDQLTRGSVEVRAHRPAPPAQIQSERPSGRLNSRSIARWTVLAIVAAAFVAAVVTAEAALIWFMFG